MNIISLIKGDKLKDSAIDPRNVHERLHTAALSLVIGNDNLYSRLKNVYSTLLPLTEEDFPSYFKEVFIQLKKNLSDIYKYSPAKNKINQQELENIAEIIFILYSGIVYRGRTYYDKSYFS